MISYSEWRETEYFKLERRAFDELNFLYHELIESLSEEQRADWQKYALFHFIARAKQLVETVGALMRRMRSDHLNFYAIQQSEIDRNFNATATPGEQIGIEADESSHRYAEFLIADFEALYQLGCRLLDQWTLILRCFCATSKVKNFRSFVDDFLNSEHYLCSKLKQECSADFVWLYSHFLTFRDKFIVHQARPFQQSTINSGTDNFSVSFFVDPIWFGEENTKVFHETMWKLNERMPSSNRLDTNMIKNPNFVVGHLLQHIDLLVEHDQEILKAISKESGFTSASYQIICERLFDFIRKSVAILREYLLQHPTKIDLFPNRVEPVSEVLKKIEFH